MALAVIAIQVLKQQQMFHTPHTSLFWGWGSILFLGWWPCSFDHVGGLVIFLSHVSSRIVDNIIEPCLIMSNSYLGLACGKQCQKITISINSIFKISLVYVTFPYNLCYLVNFPYLFLHGILLLLQYFSLGNQLSDELWAYILLSSRMTCQLNGYPHSVYFFKVNFYLKIAGYLCWWR